MSGRPELHPQHHHRKEERVKSAGFPFRGCGVESESLKQPQVMPLQQDHGAHFEWQGLYGRGLD